MYTRLDACETIRTAALDTGQITMYDACADAGTRPYDSAKFKHIGDGVIHTIDGVFQGTDPDDRYSFFVRR